MTDTLETLRTARASGNRPSARGADLRGAIAEPRQRRLFATDSAPPLSTHHRVTTGVHREDR